MRPLLVVMSQAESGSARLGKCTGFSAWEPMRDTSPGNVGTVIYGLGIRDASMTIAVCSAGHSDAADCAEERRPQRRHRTGGGQPAPAGTCCDLARKNMVSL